MGCLVGVGLGTLGGAAGSPCGTGQGFVVFGSYRSGPFRGPRRDIVVSQADAENWPLFERLQGLLLTVGDIDQFLTELAQIATTVLPATKSSPAGPAADPPSGVLSCG